jgi:hypothetical protein
LNVIWWRKKPKKPLDCLMTVLSKGTLVFVCNKSAMGGWGLAEGHRQRATEEIAKIAGNAKMW